MAEMCKKTQVTSILLFVHIVSAVYAVLRPLVCRGATNQDVVIEMIKVLKLNDDDDDDDARDLIAHINETSAFRSGCRPTH